MKKEDIVITGTITSVEHKETNKDGNGNLWRKYMATFDNDDKEYNFTLLPHTPKDNEPKEGQQVTLYKKGKNVYMNYQEPKKQGSRNEYLAAQTMRTEFEKETLPGKKVQGIGNNIAQIVSSAIAAGKTTEKEIKTLVQLYLECTKHAYGTIEDFLNNLETTTDEN